MFFQLYKDSQGLWRWRLVASNRQIIAASAEGYYNKQDCLRMVELIKREANSTPVYES
jgi:uncharacterized protein YegP (UPF0339 family)